MIHTNERSHEGGIVQEPFSRTYYLPSYNSFVAFTITTVIPKITDVYCFVNDFFRQHAYIHVRPFRRQTGGVD